MTAAAAKILRKRFAHIGFARMLLARKKRGCSHDHSVSAIAALRGLFSDERRLHGARPVGTAKPFQSGDLMVHGIDGARDT